MSRRARIARWSTALRSAQRPTRVLGINRRNVDFVYELNRRRDFPLADDKLQTKALLSAAGIPVPRTLRVVRGFFEIPAAARWLAEHPDAVVKPSQGKAGGGVLVLRPQPPMDRIEREAILRSHLSGILGGAFSGGDADVALVEERLVPHPTLAELWGGDVVDLRVILHRGAAIQAMLRIPTVASRGRSNLHAGGLGVGVELASGLTLGGSWRGRPLDCHPDTGGPLAGVRIPDWPLIVDIAVRTAAQVPLGYLGVDIALDGTRGPNVLEINARPGLEIQNVNRRGLMALLKRDGP